MKQVIGRGVENDDCCLIAVSTSSPKKKNPVNLL